MGCDYRITEVGHVVRWTCDTDACRATEDSLSTGATLPSLLPPDWSVVTVTSMTDVQRYIQCPTHTTDLHRRYSDGTDHFENMKARG